MAKSAAARKPAKKALREVTGEKPAMWGASIIGCGSHR